MRESMSSCAVLYSSHTDLQYRLRKGMGMGVSCSWYDERHGGAASTLSVNHIGHSIEGTQVQPLTGRPPEVFGTLKGVGDGVLGERGREGGHRYLNIHTSK